MNKLQSYAKSKPQIIAIYMHGSQVKGYAASNSDTDVAVVVENRQNLKDEFRLMGEVSDNLEVKNPDVRIVDQDSSEIFLFEVISGKLIYQRDQYTRIRFESNALRNYYDMEQVREIYRRYLYNDLTQKAYASK